MSVDPVTAYSNGDWRFFNRYAYAFNNPYRFTDPDGRDPDIGYGAGVALMMGDNPERMRVWAGGEAAATTEGSAAERGAAMGQAIGDFIESPEISGERITQLATVVVIGKITRGKETGHYTNTHKSGMKYHGKGGEARMQRSAAEKAKANNDPVVDTKHTPAETTREAFKGEAKSIEADGGPGKGNYNKINSPGKKYIEEDKIR